MNTSRRNPVQQVIDAVFRDVPGELDRLIRESEFVANRLYDQPSVAESLDAVSRRRRRFHPTVLLGILSLALLFFGPTFGSLCTALGRPIVLTVLAITLALLVVWLAFKTPRLIAWWVRFPDDAEIDPGLWLRRFVARAALIVGTLMPLALLVFSVFAAWQSLTLYDDGLCVSTAPARLPSLIQLAVFAACASICVLVSRFGTPMQQRPVHEVTLLFGFAALAHILIVYVFADGADREALQTPYFHVFAFGVLALMLVALLARLLASLLFRSTTAHAGADAMRRTLQSTELFQRRIDDVRSDSHIVDAFFRSIVGKPGLTLLPASLAAVLAAPAWVKHAFFAGLIVALLLNTWSRLNKRWSTIFNLVQRGFFVGWPTAISYLVILIGLTRFAEVSYVTTIVDSAPLGFFPVLIVLGYASLWFFEYWINREIGKRYLQILGADKDGDWLDYRFDRQTGRTAVNATPRWLQLHGTGRLAVVGYYFRGKEKRIAWHTYSYGDFLERLRSRIVDVDESQASTQEAANTLIDDLKRRTALYFNSINASIAVIIAAVALVGIQANNEYLRSPVAVGIETGTDDPRRFSLADAIAGKCSDEAAQCDELIALAASGGGSRAALHAVGVLRALAAEQRIDDVALVSGVSGGGASLAYFAARHASLIDRFPSDAWDCFVDAMSTSFIQQVIESIGEVRMVRQTTLAHALAEALDEQYVGGRCGEASATSLLDVETLGLILNTTVAGHPADSSPIGARLFANEKVPSTESAGARLAFTNLADVAAFPLFDRQKLATNRAYPDASILPYRVVAADGITLAQAAALNANFPPVFPNSEVRIKTRSSEGEGTDRFFVTDGGVTENRGIVSLLLALQSAVRELKARPDEQAARYPDIRIIVADAGSLSYDYKPDRGIGTAVSGRPQFLLANAWLRALLDDVTNEYRMLTGATIEVETRPMAAALRLSGAIGTHWMLPASVYLQDPTTALDSADDRRYPINRRQARCLVVNAYTGDPAECLADLDVAARESILTILALE